MLGYQTLDTVNLIEYQRPYMELPRITAVGLWSPQRFPLLNLSLDSEVVNFTRSCLFPSAPPPTDNGNPPPALPVPCPNYLNAEFPLSAAVDGWRLNARPQIGLDVSGPGYFSDPASPGISRNTSCAIPLASTPTIRRYAACRSWMWTPVCSLNGYRLEQRTQRDFEPRVRYVYIPYRNQSDLPVFDTATPDLNTIELFRPNRFVGIDRIGDANSLTVGATTQWFETPPERAI